MKNVRGLFARNKGWRGDRCIPAEIVKFKVYAALRSTFLNALMVMRITERWADGITACYMARNNYDSQRESEFLW